MLYSDIGIHYKYFMSVSQFPFISPLKSLHLDRRPHSEPDVSVGLAVRKVSC